MEPGGWKLAVTNTVESPHEDAYRVDLDLGKGGLYDFYTIVDFCGGLTLRGGPDSRAP